MRNKNFIRNYYPLLIVGIGFVLILILGFFVFKSAMEKETTKLSSIEELCKSYPQVESGVSCAGAVKLAVEKYPGDVYEVKRVNRTMLNIPNISPGEAWIIGIKSAQPITIEKIMETANRIKMYVAIDEERGIEMGIYSYE